jgi:hypothetical protein
MPLKSRFHRLDAFTKTVEDARVRTTSGGVVTIASLLVIFWLVWGEWSDYRKITVSPELIVDKSRGTSAVPKFLLPSEPMSMMCSCGSIVHLAS